MRPVIPQYSKVYGILCQGCVQFTRFAVKPQTVEIKNPVQGAVYGYQEGVIDANIDYEVLKIDGDSGEPLAGVTLQLLTEKGIKLLSEKIL